ncbi:MAG: WbqC family protein, partial [Bacteroidales bacterium]|nr:WbqC family protein [Bacteroidales bacterium]MBP8678054.1 WbqC family protein [Bacteroidales bacterium]
LDFVQPKLTEYKQYNDNFVPGLSIIDILMFNDKKVVKEMMKSYTLL